MGYNQTIDSGLQAYAILKAMGKFGKIPGRKALQKILYFVNLKEKIFSYQWNSYGPYSEEVKYMLEYMATNHQISVKQELHAKGRIQFNMEMTEYGGKHLDSMRQSPEIDSRVEFAHKLLAGKSPRMMELLASVHYIASYDGGRCFDRTFDIISELKPDANFKQDDVNDALSELQNADLLDVPSNKIAV